MAAEEIGRAEMLSSPNFSSIRQTGASNRMGVVSRRISRSQYQAETRSGAVTHPTSPCDNHHKTLWKMP